MVDEKLQSVFRRAFRRELGPSNFAVNDIQEWDSLTHVKLVMELELAFDISICPEDIPSLYTDYDTIKKYVVNSAPGS